MSIPNQIPEAPTTKTTSLEYPLQNIPSSLELAPNGQDNPQKLTSPSGKAADHSGLDPDAFRRLSLSTVSGLSDDGRVGRSTSYISRSRYTSHSPASPRTWPATLRLFWQRNRGLWLVTISQFFGALMNVTARLLELDGPGMHPFQVLFARMGLTMIFCCVYMWYTKVPYFPLGKKEVRNLLIVRGLAGFFGIYGVYYSLLYLPLAEATVITFLSPTLAGYACYLIFSEPFTRIEQIASMISLLGVVLIARPTSFFHLSNQDSSPDSPPDKSNITSTVADHGYHFPTPTSAQHLSAIAIALVGVAGAACVFMALRRIGQRAHPLISVNYFATWCFLVSVVALSIGPHIPPPFGDPNLHLALPASLKQWGMLFFLGTCGFIMQFMMTAGLSHEKSNRATNMVYTNMLFALLFDKWVFGTVPGMWSLLGSGLILGSAIYVAVQKGVAGDERIIGQEVEVGLMSDEETAMMEDVDDASHAECGGESQSMPLMEINVRDYDEETRQSVANLEYNHAA